MEGYQLRSQFVPVKEARDLKKVPSISDSASHATTKGIRRNWCLKAKNLVSAELAGGVDLPELGADLETVISDGSGATMNAPWPPFANLPQESSDISAFAEVPRTLLRRSMLILGSLLAFQAWEWGPTLMSGLPLGQTTHMHNT